MQTVIVALAILVAHPEPEIPAPVPALDLTQTTSSTGVPGLESAKLSEDINWWGVGGWSTGIAAAVFFGGTRAWWDEGYEPFNVKDTGWLERDTYSGGHDKIGHVFSAYAATHTMAYIYKSYGLSHRAAIWAAIGYNIFVMNGFEFVDGFTKYGFEYADSVANTIGFGLSALTWLYPSVYESFGMRVGYFPSNDFLDNERSLIKFINDYTGQIYYFDFKLKGILSAMNVESSWAQYLVGGVAFSTNHYSPVRRHELRQRLWGGHIGLNTAEVFRTFSDSGKTSTVIRTLLNYYALPFLSVSVLKDLNDGPWYVNFGIANNFQVEF